MKRLLSVLCSAGVLSLTVMASAASAQVSVNVSANPDPFSQGSTITISVSAFWPIQSSYCNWASTCRAEYVEVTISGSDGFWDYRSGGTGGGGGTFLLFSDSTPGSTMEATSYYVGITVYYYDFEMGWWGAVENGSGSTSVQPAATAPPPTISGPDTVWYFNGQNPSGYATSVTLTSDGGPSTRWEIAQGGNKVNLSGEYGTSVVITPTGIISSGYPGDILIVASVSGGPATTFAMTTRRPYRLVAEGPQDRCDPEWGYQTVLPYTIQDQLLDPLPAPVPLNEAWESGRDTNGDWPGTNWLNANPHAFPTPADDPARFADGISGGRKLNESPYPIPGCSGDGSLVDFWEQRWSVGSLAIGSGQSVQLDTLERRKDFARHANIRY